MTECLDCGTIDRVYRGRCLDCRRMHAIQMQLLRVFHAGEHNWLGADRHPADQG